MREIVQFGFGCLQVDTVVPLVMLTVPSTYVALGRIHVDNIMVAT